MHMHDYFKTAPWKVAFGHDVYPQVIRESLSELVPDIKLCFNRRFLSATPRQVHDKHYNAVDCFGFRV